MTKTKKKPKKSFLLTLPGLLTAIATLITAVVAFIAVFKGSLPEVINLFSSSDISKYEIKVNCPEVVPYYMKNFMYSQEFLPWFKISVHNKSEENLHIEVSFKVRQGPALAREEPAVYSINPGEYFSQSVDPAFEFLKEDINVPLEVILKIRDHKDNILHQDTRMIEVLQKNILDWDLKSVEGNQISKDFLLASLSAWILISDNETNRLIKKLSMDFETNNQTDTLADQWIFLCYKELFNIEPVFQITANLKTLSLKGKQNIGTPSQVLKKGRGDPLETVLLFSKISFKTFEKLGIRLLIFMIPKSSDNNQHLFLSWSKGLSNFKAIDLISNKDTSFEMNIEQSTFILEQFLATHPTIIDKLSNSGVYVSKDRSIFALDFTLATDAYSISALP